MRFYFFQKFNFCFAASFFLPFPADFCRKGYFRYNAANNKNYVDFLKAKSFFVFYVLPASGRLTLLIRSRAQYARRIFPQRKRRLRASYLLGRYPVALFPFLFISAGLRRKGEKLFFKTPPSASYVSSKRSPRFHPRAADTSQFFGQSLCLFIRLSILNSLSWRKLVSFAHA